VTATPREKANMGRVELDGGKMALHHGDCLAVMRGMEAASVTAIVTDPPYGLSFMGKEWDHGVPGEPYWAEALRVAKPGAMLLAFGGTRTFHRLACAIEDAGWHIRDCLLWLQGQGFPKSLDVSKAIDKAKGAKRERIRGVSSNVVGPVYAQDKWSKANKGSVLSPLSLTTTAEPWSGYGTAMKPAWEAILMAMKPVEGTFAANAERHGVAGINVDACRIGTHKRVPGGSQTTGAPCWLAKHGLASGFGPRDPNHSGMRADVGRWPANVILDEEAAEMLDEQSGELKSGKPTGQRRANHHWKSEETGTPLTGIGDSGGASRFFYVAKARTAERTAGGRVVNKHPTVKPLALMEWLCRLVTMPAGTVILDPFMGSGTTGVACRRLGVDFVGIDNNAESFQTAKARIGVALGDLFQEDNQKGTLA